MTTDLAKTYSPSHVEGEIARRWDKAGAFRAEPSDEGAPYCIVIPPPNVTAALHMGHALNNTLQDILIRHHRMLGRNTLWMPGTDHAGIATQTVVEKRILADEGKKRTDFGRHQFVKKIQAWKDEYEAQITGQLKAIGCSCDWDRQRFTMDPVCARAVREAFFRLFRDGLIYRGKRLVNWDPATQTALADDEVEMQDIDGHFWYLRYPIEDGRGYVTVATTRPETMLGDTAVAVNPADPRAAALRGKKVRLPIVNRVVPIVEDEYVVLPDPDGDEKARYSSGFLKVTPAHDPRDYEIGQRFGLDMINVMAPDGTISDQHGWPPEDIARAEVDAVPLGLDRFEAREEIVQWFRENGLLEDVKPYRHAVGHSYRSHVPIEPYLSDQWYVKVTDERLAGAALRAMVEDQYQRHEDTKASAAADMLRHEGAHHGEWEGKLRFVPARYAKTFQAWHENIRDWCISRQLWWGHRIPVWSKAATHPDEVGIVSGINASRFASGCERAAVHEESGVTYVCLREDDPQLVAKLEADGFVQDEDVLDTWFSSALWPFSTLGWPDDSPDLEKWNPGNLICTAREIITLWVSRMVMMNLYLLHRLPFTDVFIHAMIQDGEGRKMSKSLGNGVDPLDIIHSHGADAMRFTLASMTTNTQDVRMPVTNDPQTGRNTSEKFDIGRNFANKLWNAARFALANLQERHEGDGPSSLLLADRWILSRLAVAVRDTDAALRSYEFSQYAQGLYDFFWRDFCDWYIEAVKPTVGKNPSHGKVLAACLDVSLRLLHPMMPFVTEKLWERLNQIVPGPERERCVEGLEIPAGELLVRSPWPKAHQSLIDQEAESQFALVSELVTGIRSVRTEHKVPPRQKLDISIRAAADSAEQFSDQRGLIETLANVTLVRIGPDAPRPQDAVAAVVGDTQAYLHGLIDAEAEHDRLNKRLDDVTNSINRLQGRLANKSYVEKAPEHLVQQTREQLAETQREAKTLQEQLESIGRSPH